MDTELKRGTVVGDYRLETEVCVAGIHRLWLAENRTSGEAVALKIPRRDRASETVLEECISRERQALDWIRTVGGHPNLMNLRESVSGDGEAILVVDPVDGDKLGEVVEWESRLDTDEARDIGIDICDAMSFLHEREIVYRDIKPSNILLDSQQTPTIIDLTAATQSDRYDPSPSGGLSSRDHHPTWFVGGEFKPPEMFDDRPGDPGPWSTVYSLGKIIFYFITAQKFSTHGLTPSDVEGTSPSYLDDIVERATAADPAARYSNPTALKHALERKDPTPPQTAKLSHVGGDHTCEIEDGDTIGRDEPPKTSLSLPADEAYVSRVHCRITRDPTGSWVLEDLSTNGTYHHGNGDWVELLSPNGKERLRSKGSDVEATTDSKQLEPGDTFALVDPNYDRETRFTFRGGA